VLTVAIVRANDAITELQELRQQRAAAAGRVGDLEREQRATSEQVAQASARLTEAERTGASTTAIRKAEQELAAARERAGQRWSERAAGARAAVRDLGARTREYVGENLAELVEVHEAEGEIAAAKLNAAATELLAAAAEWNSVASMLGATITLVASPSPGDVGRSQAEEAVRAVAVLVADGGERGPVLVRDREPWSRLLGGQQEAEAQPERVPA